MATQEAELTAPRSPGLKRALGLLFKAVIALVTGAVIAILAGASLPSLFGFHPMVVTSGSMTPLINTGDVVILRDVPADRIAVGDVVTFRQRDGEGMTTHRVLALKEMPDGTWIQTKGDANENPDPDLTHVDAVYGEVRMRIPRIGPALLFASTPVGKLALLGVPALLMMLSEIGGFRSALRARRARRPVPEAIPSPSAVPEIVTRPAVLPPAFAFSARTRRVGRAPVPAPVVAQVPVPAVAPAVAAPTFAYSAKASQGTAGVTFAFSEKKKPEDGKAATAPVAASFFLS